MFDQTLFAQVLDPASRPNPYPLYTLLRKQPVALQADGTYVVSTYAEIRALLTDARLSSNDLPNTTYPPTGNFIKDWILNPLKARYIDTNLPLLFRDPPDHHRLRTKITKHFNNRRMQGLKPAIDRYVNALIHKLHNRETFDLVSEFAFPLPVSVIAGLLGIADEDAPQLYAWATIMAGALEPDRRIDEEEGRKIVSTYEELIGFFQKAMKAKRRHPQDDLLSDFVTEPWSSRLSHYDLIATAVLFLVAGHETTGNLISNMMLVLLRNVSFFPRLSQDPQFAALFVEEVLRFETPVHFRTRKAIERIEIGGRTIPMGAPVILLLASASRDPRQFVQADRFDPERANNNLHLGFGGGLHYCLGAPLARLEAEAALQALSRRLVNLRLLDENPPYRRGASLRGPSRLMLGFDRVKPS